MTDTWKTFETLTQRIQQQLAPEAVVTHDEKLKGKSGVLHQCDVVLRAPVGQYEFFAVLECKDWAEKVGLDVIRSFQSKISDIEAMKGIVVSASGFTSEAKRFAQSNNISTYSLVDAESVKWREEAIIPIVVKHVSLKNAQVSTISQATNETISLVDKEGKAASEDKTDLFDAKKNRHLLVRQFMEEQWDEILSTRDIPKPTETFTTEQNRFSLYAGDDKYIPVVVRYSFEPEIRIHYHHLSLNKCQGFIDQQSGDLLTAGYISSPLDFIEAIKTWPWKDRDEDLPFRPVLCFWMARFFQKRSTPAPKAITIQYSSNKKQE